MSGSSATAYEKRQMDAIMNWKEESPGIANGEFKHSNAELQDHWDQYR